MCIRKLVFVISPLFDAP